jgi:hypothetical protein
MKGCDFFEFCSILKQLKKSLSMVEERWEMDLSISFEMEESHLGKLGCYDSSLSLLIF